MIKSNQNIILRAFTLLLCFYIAIVPFFQPKKVYASLSDKIINFERVAVAVIMGLRSVGFISDTTLTPENLENIYNKADAYLHENFGTELEYAEALRQVDQLGLDIASGKIFIPGNYSGKLWYSFLNAVIDTLYPATPDNIDTIYDDYSLLGTYDHYAIYVYLQDTFTENGRTKYKLPYFPTSGWIAHADNSGAFVPAYYNSNGNLKKYAGYKIQVYDFVNNKGMYYVTNINSGGGLYFGFGPDYREYYDKSPQILSKFLGFLNSGGNSLYRPSLTKQMPSKLKLPTRLPQTVINNINNYIDNSTENLIIAPTADELPQLPEDYNPSTDDPPDLPGYEDVTPDQEPTPTPTPTPSPTPEPTPTPTAPEYDGSKWVNPIGEFIAGLLEFLKSAFIPTMSIDTSPLTDANFDMANKFPFSLPNTFKTLLITVNAPGKTPVFDMTFDMTKLGFEAPIVWHIDLHEWDTGAEIAKTSLYIIFLLGLILMTKKLFVK